MQDNQNFKIDEENLSYLWTFLGQDRMEDFYNVVEGKGQKEDNKNVELVCSCLMAMQKAGDNKWWKSQDPRMRAYYQAHCKVYLVTFQQFQSDLYVLLGKRLNVAEVIAGRNALMKEVEEAFNASLEEKADD